MDNTIKKEKIKDSRINIKIDEDLRNRFLSVAKANDDNASQILRRFIKDYLVKHSQTKMNF